MVKSKNWSAEAESEKCVRVKIDDDISIDYLKMKIIDEERKVLLDEDVISHNSCFCFPTGRPIYVELYQKGELPSMKYVHLSGFDFYESTSKQKTYKDFN